VAADIAKLKAQNVVKETFEYYLSEAANGWCKIPRRVADDMSLGYASLVSRIEELEREQNKWNELVKAVRELRGYDETWPDHGNAPLAIAAGYALALRRAEAAETRVEELKAALQKARNTLGGLGYAKIAQDICDDALGDQ